MDKLECLNDNFIYRTIKSKEIFLIRVSVILTLLRNLFDELKFLVNCLRLNMSYLKYPEK